MTVVLIVVAAWAVLLPALVVSSLSACRAVGTRRLAQCRCADCVPTLNVRRRLVTRRFVRTRGACRLGTRPAVPLRRHARH
jgi:hypothetical protein